MTYTLRQYQQELVDRTRGALSRGQRSALLVAPTGSGKTVVACHIIEQAKAKGTRTLFVAHRTELITQCSGKLHENGVDHGIIKAGFEPNPWLQVQVASVQTYVRRADAIKHEYGLVIFDEAHHAAAASYQKIREHNPDAIALGLTATPYRADGKGLKGTFDCLIESVTIDELIAQGHLVPSRVFVGRKVSMTGVSTRAGDYQIDELAETMNRPRITGEIVSAWSRLAYGRVTVCFATNVAHSQALAAAFVARGIRAEHLDGTTPADERAAILERLERGETQVVCNCGVLTEGWDCPPCSAIILARPTKSRGLWRQMGGRPLRPCPEIHKVDCLILDHGNCTAQHGYITDPDVVSLEEGMRAPDVTTKYRCKACSAVCLSRPLYCPKCGVCTRESRQLEIDLAATAGTMVDGWEMIEVTPATYRPKPKPSPAAGEFLFLRDVKTGKERGYKPGWANARHQRRYGHWPNRELLAKAGNVA